MHYTITGTDSILKLVQAVYYNWCMHYTITGTAR